MRGYILSHGCKFKSWARAFRNLNGLFICQMQIFVIELLKNNKIENKWNKKLWLAQIWSNEYTMRRSME